VERVGFRIDVFRLFALVAMSVPLAGCPTRMACQPFFGARPADKGQSAGQDDSKKEVPIKRLDSFLGVNLAQRFDPKNCKSNGMPQREFACKTVSCEVEKNDAHTVWILFAVDERFPQFFGKAVMVYAFINRSVFADPVALEAYLGAVSKKYGPLAAVMRDDPEQLLSSVQYCNGSECDKGLVRYSPYVPFMGFDINMHYGPLYFHQLSLSDYSVFEFLQNLDDAKKKNAAASAVK
jgi:hypothetical protein